MVDLRHIASAIITAALLLLGNYSCTSEEATPTEDTAGLDENMVTEVLFKPEACERVTKTHDMVSMHYTGVLTDTGVKFDSSHDRNQPFQFQLGVGQVIQGWEKGLLDMCVGEKRRLVVPPHLGYGDVGAGELIPPKSSLTFEVELMNIQDGIPPQNVFKEIDANDDQLLSQEEISNFMKEQAQKTAPDSKLPEEQQDMLIAEIFKHADKDNDGFISNGEFSGSKHDEL